MREPDDSDSTDLPEATPHDDDLYFTASRRSIRRAGWVFIIACVIGGIGLVAWNSRSSIERWVRGEIDLSGEATFSYEPTDGNVEGLELIHAELLPAWIIAEANRNQWGAEHADKAWDELEAALRADPNLLEIANETHAILRADGQLEQLDRLVYLMRSWSNYLSENGEPFLVQGNSVATANSSFFYVKTYRVEADLQVEVGSKPYRSRIVRRLDNTNVRESYLGATSRGADGAIILINRIYTFALDELLPIISGETAARWEAWAAPVRAELEGELPKDHVAALTRAHGHLVAIDEVFRAVDERRACGNRLVIVRPGHVGVSPDTLAQLERWATDDPLDLCPSITEAELDTLRAASQALREDKAYHRALGGLMSLVARGVALHEARHVADDVRHDGLLEPLPCSVCSARDGTPTRAELSAYITSFAWGPTPATTFFQACSATDGRGGPHARAMRHILTGLDHSCADGPPANLTERARELESTWFSRSERAVVPADFPRVIDLKGVRR